MARRLDPDSQAALDIVKMEEIGEKQAELEAKKEWKKRLEPYTDGLPYDRDRVIAEAKRHLYQSFNSIVEFGKYLIWIQSEEAVHPGGLPFEQCIRVHFPNLSRRFIFNAMRLARVAVEHPKLQGLIEKQRSKAIALLEILDEEDLSEFDEADTIAGMKIDEVEKMPARQLKEKLRSYKKKVQRGEEQLREAERKIEQLKDQVERLKLEKADLKDFSPEDQEHLALLYQVQADFLRLIFNIKERLRYENISPMVARQLYCLYIFMNMVATDERIALHNFYEDAQESPWDIVDSEIPPAEVLVENMPLTRELADSFRKYMQKRSGDGGGI